jgi:hypothetical protein
MKNEDIIFASSGLFFFNKRIFETILNNKNRLYFWGTGHNKHFKPTTQLNKPGNFEDYVYHPNVKVIGVRDYGTDRYYIPCVSCMDTLFNINFDIKNEIVVYKHNSYDIAIKDYPTKSNYSSSLFDVIEFLGSAMLIITNSYHGVYWSQLLGKKVLLYRPFSTKFWGFKYKPVICDQYNYKEKMKLCEPISSNFLKESRKLNIYLYNCINAALNAQ